MIQRSKDSWLVRTSFYYPQKFQPCSGHSFSLMVVIDNYCFSVQHIFSCLPSYSVSEKPQTHIYPGISGVNYCKGWRLWVNVKKEWPQEPDPIDKGTRGSRSWDKITAWIEGAGAAGTGRAGRKCTHPAPAALLQGIRLAWWRRVKGKTLIMSNLTCR